MKRLLFSFAIMLFASAAATTAWGEASEQETKDFIVSTLNKCGVQYRAYGGRSWTVEALSPKFDAATLTVTSKTAGAANVATTQHIPLDKVSNVSVLSTSASEGAKFTYLAFACLGSEGACVQRVYEGESNPIVYSTGFIGNCSETTNATLAKAFNHLIGIYKANRPKPLFE